jgi:hypothetical protein
MAFFKDDAVGSLDLVAKGKPFGGRAGLQILTEKPEIVQRHDVQFQRVRRQFRQRMRDLERKRLFAEAADDDERVVRGHVDILSMGEQWENGGSRKPAWAGNLALPAKDASA